MDRRIEWALAEIHARLAAPLHVAELATALNLSPSRFSHLFAAQVGTSPVRYVHAVRMIRSRLLLERTFLSVKEVMSQVGCNDPSHFARDFRRFHGASPREWRASRLPGRHAKDAGTLESLSVFGVAALANERRNRPTESEK